MINSSPFLRTLRQWVEQRLATAGVAAALCGLLSPAYAQDEAPNWFQIEVILFANQAQQWQESELWRDKFELIYPDNLVILKPYREYELEEFDTDYSVLRRNMPGEQQQSDTDFPAQRREHTSPGQRALEQQEGASFTQFGQVFQDPRGEGMQKTRERPAKLEKPMDLERDPFILLPGENLQMQSAARRIKNAPDLRLLGHFAWRQPLDEKPRSVPVLVRAGNQFGLDFELEGTLTVSKNRYLHVDSELYFSRFQRTLVTDSSNWGSFYDTPANPPGPFPGDAQPGFGAAFDAGGLNLFDQPTSSAFKRTLSASASDSRRLKSEELHYIDHPLFGILVRMTPHELPDPVLEMKDFDVEALPGKKPLPVAPLAPLTPGPTPMEGVGENP